MSSVHSKPKQPILTTSAEGSAPRGERAQFEKSPLRESCGDGGKVHRLLSNAAKPKRANREARSSRAGERGRKFSIVLRTQPASGFHPLKSLFLISGTRTTAIEQSEVSNRPARRRRLRWALSSGRGRASVRARAAQDAEVKLRFLSYGRAVSPASPVLCTARPCERFYVSYGRESARLAQHEAHTCTHWLLLSGVPF